MSTEAPRVAFVTLGCKVNQTETAALAGELGLPVNGCEPESADVVVINTCTVTGEADRKARKAVRHALGLPGAPVVVVTGCLAALDAAGLGALGDRVVVEADKALVSGRVKASLPGRWVSNGATVLRFARTRAQLKVEDGCDGFCTYCIVPYARGLPRPVPIERVMADAAAMVAAGAREIVLTGINIGRYDDRGARLPEVIERVAATGVARIRLSSIEPADVDERLLAAASRTPAFCAHLHVPLQSGADEVLARMGRPYDAAAYADILGRARGAFPGIAISTDVIVGFPGETDAEFAETFAFVEDMAFSRLHVFRYSARGGTPAASMAGQVAPTVKAERAAALRELGERLAARYVASRVGERSELLVERVVKGDGIPMAEGVTREYVRARVCSAAPAGALVPFIGERADGDGALAGRSLA